jgi:cellulose synthase/poly-beta-1,6-N-acetylglucosamine synthase-like glycosyltransferase
VSTGTRDMRALDAVRDIRDFAYKIPGLFTYSILLLLFVGILTVPDFVLVIAQVCALYLVFYLFMVVFFYPIGLIRIRRWEAHFKAGARAADGRGDWVRHVVLIPNYKEPIEVLARTLRSLAAQEDARRRVIVVLAMEKSETGAAEKVRLLREMFGDQFAHFLVTFHPAGIPGEVPGKGSNQNWAARRAKQELVDRLGIPLEHLTLTSCDADSVLHPSYFAALTQLFATDPHRYQRFWQAPLRFDNNTWQVPSAIRLVTYFANALQVSELANPVLLNFPLSTYSLSFRLADVAGYWDSAVIAEDWHMFLRCSFAAGGRVNLRPIFLPTSGNAVDGDTTWQSLTNSYQQRLRHAWGAQDVGYIFHQWPKSPQTPFIRKLLLLAKVVHDHLIFSTGGLVVAAGSVLLVTLHTISLIFLPVLNVLGGATKVGNVCVAVGMVGILVAEHLRCRRHSHGWSPAALLADMVTWPFLSIIMFGTLGMPVIHAQTKLMLGSPLGYVTTPKKADAPTN